MKQADEEWLFIPSWLLLSLLPPSLLFLRPLPSAPGASFCDPAPQFLGDHSAVNFDERASELCLHGGLCVDGGNNSRCDSVGGVDSQRHTVRPRGLFVWSNRCHRMQHGKTLLTAAGLDTQEPGVRQTSMNAIASPASFEGECTKPSSEDL